MQDTFGQIDSSQASAGSDADRDKIAAAIEEGVGFKQLDGMILERLRDWALGAQQAAAALWPEMIAGYEALGQSTMAAKENYAIVLESQGKLEEAELDYREVVEGQTTALGDKHTSTLRTKFNLDTFQDHQDTQAARQNLPMCGPREADPVDGLGGALSRASTSGGD